MTSSVPDGAYRFAIGQRLSAGLCDDDAVADGCECGRGADCVLLTTRTVQWNRVVTKVSTTSSILGTMKLAAASRNWIGDISVSPDGNKI